MNIYDARALVYYMMSIVVIVVMIVRAVNVAMSQFFFGRFANRHNFNVEFQVLTGQHVVTINQT